MGKNNWRPKQLDLKLEVLNSGLSSISNSWLIDIIKKLALLIKMCVWQWQGQFRKEQQ